MNKKHHKGLTLIETMFALFIASVLFLTLFRFTNLTYTTTISKVKENISLNNEFRNVIAYEESILKGRLSATSLNIVVSDNYAYSTFKSQLGYDGVLIK